MSEGQRGWLLLLMLSLFLITIGFQGNLGLTFGIIFCPQEILIGDEKG